jgi:hypothetical protein
MLHSEPEAPLLDGHDLAQYLVVADSLTSCWRGGGVPTDEQRRGRARDLNEAMADERSLMLEEDDVPSPERVD